MKIQINIEIDTDNNKDQQILVELVNQLREIQEKLLDENTDNGE